MRLALANSGSGSLSLVGILVVLKVVASTIPMYHMALYKAPLGVVNSIEKLMRKFLWGRQGGGERSHGLHGSTCVGISSWGGSTTNSK